MVSLNQWVRNRQVNARLPFTSLLSLGVVCICLGVALAGFWAIIHNIRHHQLSPSTAMASSDTSEPTWDQPAWQVTSMITTQLPQIASLPSQPAQRHPLAPSAYHQAMTVGYAAYQQKDYHTALINFRRALGERADDRYAMEAIANTEAIIQYHQP